MTDDSTPKAPKGHDISAVGDRYEALAEFLEQHASQTAEDRAREVQERERREQTKSPPYWLLGVLLLLTAWLWLFPPGFLRMDRPEPQPIEQEEDALRFTMYLQAQRIASYQEETGSLPERLDEAGPPLPNMQYTRLAPGLYQLTATTDRLVLTYRSDLPLDEFVGSGADIVDEGGR